MTSCLSSKIRALGTINQPWSFEVNVVPYRRNTAEYILCDLLAHDCYISSRIFIPCKCMQIINLHWMLHILISWPVSLQLPVQMTFHSGFNPKLIKVKRRGWGGRRAEKPPKQNTQAYFQNLVASEPSLALLTNRRDWTEQFL